MTELCVHTRGCKCCMYMCLCALSCQTRVFAIWLSRTQSGGSDVCVWMSRLRWAAIAFNEMELTVKREIDGQKSGKKV